MARKGEFRRPKARDFHDNPRKRGPPDRNTINLKEPWERREAIDNGTIKIEKRKTRSGETVGVVHIQHDRDGIPRAEEKNKRLYYT